MHPLVKQLFDDYVPEEDQRQRTATRLPIQPLASQLPGQPLYPKPPAIDNSDYISIGVISVIGQVGGILFSVNKKTGLVKGIGNYFLGGLIGGAIGLGYNEFKKMKRSAARKS